MMILCLESFFTQGLCCPVMLLIACAAIGAVVFFTRRSDYKEGIKLIFFCLLMVIPCSYLLPLASLIKVWKQERSHGDIWKNQLCWYRQQSSFVPFAIWNMKGSQDVQEATGKAIAIVVGMWKVLLFFQES